MSLINGIIEVQSYTFFLTWPKNEYIFLFFEKSVYLQVDMPIPIVGIGLKMNSKDKKTHVTQYEE